MNLLEGQKEIRAMKNWALESSRIMEVLGIQEAGPKVPT